MPGVTKRIFLHEMREILNDWNSQLKCIRNTLPKEYSPFNEGYILSFLFDKELRMDYFE